MPHLQLRAWLVDSDPEVWRRLVVDPRLTLEQLHTVLQHAFGWTNSHMHQFHEKDGTRYAIPTPWDRDFETLDRMRAGASGKAAPEVRDERKVLLAEVFHRASRTIAYEYDFGDSWIHAVKLEKRVDSETLEFPTETFVVKGKGMFSGKPRAAVCIAGERNGPPEDCGGFYGFHRILELIRIPAFARARSAHVGYCAMGCGLR